MEGVTTAIVLFVFACVLFPRVVRNKPQYYFAVGCVLTMIVFGALGIVAEPGGGLSRFVAVAVAVLQVLAILALILGTSGQSAGELRDEMARAYEVIRRGEEEKEVIVPITGAKPRVKDEDDDADERPGRINLDEELEAIRTPSRPPQRPEDRSPIPLE